MSALVLFILLRASERVPCVIPTEVGIQLDPRVSATKALADPTALFGGRGDDNPWAVPSPPVARNNVPIPRTSDRCAPFTRSWRRSEEHTSELQSQSNLVCRL